MTSRNHLARRTPFGGMPVGTGFVGTGDTLATDCSTLKHRRGGTVSWRSTTPTSAFAPKPRGSRRISRIRPTAVDTPLCIQSARLCEPFAGTGTFVARLLQLGVIPPEALERKYKNEIFANEFVLLSYYIASINIEQVYHQVRAEQGVDEGYVEFPGMTLTDTFQLHEGDGTITEDFEGLAANNERARAEKDSAITVIVINPPYSAGQNSANDNNQNLAYPRLDERIADTYAAKSTGANKNSLYDSHLRALRWASDRIGERGVIAFISNNSFVDGNSADGVRLSLQEEFSQIFIYDLKGYALTSGIRRQKEAGNVFGDETKTGMPSLFLSEIPPTRARPRSFTRKLRTTRRGRRSSTRSVHSGPLRESAEPTRSAPSHRTSTATGSAPARSASRPSRKLEASPLRGKLEHLPFSNSTPQGYR